MSHMVLLVVDVQNALIKAHPHNAANVIRNIKSLIEAARKHRTEVLYVRHDDGLGTDLEAGTDGWQIYTDILPSCDERIFEKQYNSAFHRTDLRAYLDNQSIDTLILVGLQTEYCIDATCKSAFDCGYQIIIPEETNTTFDNEELSARQLYDFYNYRIWNNRFAKVLPMNETLEILKHDR